MLAVIRWRYRRGEAFAPNEDELSAKNDAPGYPIR
jgi:hypothetical protein